MNYWSDLKTFRFWSDRGRRNESHRVVKSGLAPEWRKLNKGIPNWMDIGRRIYVFFMQSRRIQACFVTINEYNSAMSSKWKTIIWVAAGSIFKRLTLVPWFYVLYSGLSKARSTAPVYGDCAFCRSIIKEEPASSFSRFELINPSLEACSRAGFVPESISFNPNAKGSIHG